MKETQTTDVTSLKQPFSSWQDSHTDVFKKAEIEDAEPFRKAPAPSAFHTSEILSRFSPDPLLTITPEKSLGRAHLEKKVAPSAGGDGERKGRPRVRFAPGTRTSPPSKNCSVDSENRGPVTSAGKIGEDSSDSSKVLSDEESVPRSFSMISQKLYQPGRYVDHKEEKGANRSTSSTSASSLFSTSAPKRYTVETRGNKTVYVPMDLSAKNITSHYSSFPKDKPVAAKVVRHKPTSIHSVQDDEASSTELKEAFGSSSDERTTPQTPPRSRSTSPSCTHRSPYQPHKTSPGRYRPSPSPSPSRCSSPSRSPERLTPTGGVEFLSSILDEESTPHVQVIREAPHQPKLSNYIFPFEDEDEGRQEYDSNTESALARPEFNSALKISEELKSVKGRRPDTWGAVSHKLKTCDRKRTKIQEKASSRVNIQMQSGLYADLVDVDVPLDDLCKNVEKGITLRAPSPRPLEMKVTVGREPDLMEFFSPGLQRELPDLTLTGIQPITESLTTANPILAFDLYRHNRAWNGLTDS